MSNYIRYLINDTDRKPLFKIGYEMLVCTFREKEIPYYYLSNLLHKKDRLNYKDYIGRKRMYRVINNMFDPYNVPELQDKLIFSEIMEKNNINSPMTKRLSSNGKFYLNKKQVSLNVEEFADYLQKIIEQTSNKSIFIKPIDLNGGRNSFALSTQEISNQEKLKKVFELLKTGDFIYQETLQQHQDINRIYSQSINTVRVHSFYNEEKDEVELISALMRFGKDGAVVDNGSAGGLYVAVELKDWKLKGTGKSYYSNGGMIFESHPNSNTIFNGFELPFKEEVYPLIDKAHRLFPNKMIGWDLAFTQEGITIVEGNYSPHLVMAQVACGGFRQHEGFNRVFGEYIK